MAAQKGKLVLIKVGDGATSEAFTTIAAARTTSMTLNNQEVDITTKDTTQFRELLEGAGISSMSMSISGIFKDGASEETLRSNAFADSIDNYQFELANGDVYEGPFQITSYERAGGYDDAETYSATFASAGAITFTAA